MTNAWCSRCELHLFTTRVLTENHYRMSLILLLRYFYTNEIIQNDFLCHRRKKPIFNPITHLISLALRRDACAAKEIKSAADVYSKVVPSRLKSIHLQRKEDMLKKPIFGQAVRTPDGKRTGQSVPLRYPTFHHYIQWLE